MFKGKWYSRHRLEAATQSLEARMIVEERVYTLRPGCVSDYLRLEESLGAEIYLETMGNVVGIFSSEVGQLNQITHLVAFEDFTDRTTRRAKLKSNADWEHYAAQVRPMILRQRSSLLIPAPFSPLR
jgi:hypothetical protein